MRETLHRRPTAKTFVLDAEDNLLILRRSVFVLHGRHRADLPGGTIKRSEQPEQTAVREAKEETGLVLQHLQEVGEFGGRILYICHLSEAMPLVTTSWEHTKDARWQYFADAGLYLTHSPQHEGWESLMDSGAWRKPVDQAA